MKAPVRKRASTLRVICCTCGIVCDHAMLPDEKTVAPLAAVYTTMSAQFAAASFTGEWASRCALAGVAAPIASIS